MDQLTKNDLQRIDFPGLRKQAETIRDAIFAKTISAGQVGGLFHDLVSVVECIVQDLIDADADIGSLGSSVAEISERKLASPSRIDIIRFPASITSTNRVPQKIEARLFPRFGIGSVLFIGDNQAVEVSPDGFVTPVRPGASKVNAVATSDTSVYKSLCIEVVPPRLRLAAPGVLRLDSKGNIRLT